MDNGDNKQLLPTRFKRLSFINLLSKEFKVKLLINNLENNYSVINNRNILIEFRIK